MENETENSMENEMKTLTVFLEAHWQLVLLKGGLEQKTALKTELKTEWKTQWKTQWKIEWKHWQLSLRQTDSPGGGRHFNTKDWQGIFLEKNGPSQGMFYHKIGPTQGVFLSNIGP